MTPLFVPLSLPLDAPGLEVDLDAAMPSPFDEGAPHPAASHAAGLLLAELQEGRFAEGASAELLVDASGSGKMLGVLVARTADGRVGWLRAFSGTVAGRFEWEGWAPPLFDAAARAAVEVGGEKVVTGLTQRARAFDAAGEREGLRSALRDLERRQLVEAGELDTAHRRAREERHRRRRDLAEGAGDGAPDLAAALRSLDDESRRDKAARRQLREAHAAERAPVEAALRRVLARGAAHARLHRIVSRHLMRRIHDAYVLESAAGRRASLRSLFAPAEPPGGAADCAAPKLLAAALAQGLVPVALAEFWWGPPPPGGGRVHGRFYPACRGKCGPVLPFLLEGLSVNEPRVFRRAPSDGLELGVLHDADGIVVVDKPAGLLSVPGRDDPGGDCVEARLRRRWPDARLVHRLDLDTSGLLVAASDPALLAPLQALFAGRRVSKRYVAVVEGAPPAAEGTIRLPLRLDPADRPRQVVDAVHGRDAVTHYRVLTARGATTVLELRPETGRTHQLRVHAAHPLGLGSPIVGDRLYGSGEPLPADAGAPRLMLHAAGLSFVHPTTGRLLEFSADPPF